jgi:transposase
MPLPRSRSSSKPRKPRATKWLKLERRIEKLDGVWCEGEVLNLPGWKTIKYKETLHDVIVLAEPSTEPSLPCGCSTEAPRGQGWGYTDPSYVRDIQIRSKRTRIYFRLQRRHCSTCGKTIQQTPPAVDEKYKQTARLVEYIEMETLNIFRNFSHVANEVGCSELTVRKIYTANVLRLERGRVIETPQWLAIDEVYPKHREIVYGVISDPERRQVIEILADNTGKTVIAWLIQLPNRDMVLLVTMDMWPAYRLAVQRAFPNARIVVDRYHVHNMLNVALKSVLQVVRDSLTNLEHREYMRREKLLLKNYRRLCKKGKKDKKNGKPRPSEKAQVTKWLRDVPDLAKAYNLKKALSDILQLSDRGKAELLVDLWLKQVEEFVEYFRGKYQKKYRGKWEDPFGNVPTTFRKWREEILSYIDFKGRFRLNPTNAFAEFANKQIKKAFRMGNGYSHEVLRAKVIYGGILVNRRPPHPLDKKWTRTKRDRAARKGSVSEREVNPASNLALMTQAREENDKTKGLLAKPEETPGWIERFGSNDHYKTGSLDVEDVDWVKSPKKPAGRRRRTAVSPKQLSMF